MKKKFMLKGLCSVMAAAMVCTAVPAMNVYADEVVEEEVVMTTTSASLVEKTYDASALEVVQAWEAEELKEDGYSVKFAGQYKQIFYAIPEEIDMETFDSVTVEMDDVSDMAIKLVNRDNLGDGAAPVAYRTDTISVAEIAATAYAKKDINVIGLMTLDGEATKKIGKVVFKVQGTAEETTPDDTTPEVTEPTEDTKPEETKPAETAKPKTVTYKAKAIKLINGKSTTVTIPYKDAKIKKANVTAIKYSTSDKKIATISKKGKVSAKKVGKTTVKATVTLKSGKKVVVSYKVTVAKKPAAQKPVEQEPVAKNEYTYSISQLKVYTAFDAKLSGSTVTFDKQYAQIFFEIPAEVDMSRFDSLTVETDSTKMAIKLGRPFTNYAESYVGLISWESTTIDSTKVATGNDGTPTDSKNLTWFNIMNTLEGSATKTIKSVTFKLK